MERHAAGLEAELLGMVEHVDRHVRIAAELARQRPFGAGAAEQEAAEHLGAGGGAADLLHLGLAVDREQADAERVGARDVALLLDRVAEGDAVGRGAGREHHLDLGDRGGVEAGAERGEQRQQFGRRVRLHGIEHPAVRQRLGKGLIVVAHDVEVDDEAGAIVVARFAAAAQKVADALGHWSRSFIQVQGATLGDTERCGPALKFEPPRACAQTTGVSGCRAWRRAVRWGHGAGARLLSRRCCLGLERENPFRTAGKKMDKPLRCWPLDSQRDQKSPLRRCFKPRPPLSAGCAGFASGCRSRSEVEA